MASQGIILRNNNLVGGSGQQGGRRDLPEELRKPFEEGCYLIFMRWTALQLAIINEWGGNDSKDKAKSLFDDVLDWFYNAKGASIAPYEPGSSLAATGAGRRDGAQPLP